MNKYYYVHCETAKTYILKDEKPKEEIKQYLNFSLLLVQSSAITNMMNNTSLFFKTLVC